MSSFAARIARNGWGWWPRRTSPDRLWWYLEGVQLLSTAGSLKPSSLTDWLKGHPGTRVELVVSQALQHQLVCDAGLPLPDARAIRAYAQQQFAHYFGGEASHWPLAPWTNHEARGASALHAAEAGALLQSPRGSAHVLSVRPVCSVVLDALSAQRPDWVSAASAALAWVEGSLLCWVELRKGLLVSVRHLRLHEAHTAELMRQIAALRQPDQQVVVMGYGCGGPAPTAEPGLEALDDLDAPGPRHRWLSGAGRRSTTDFLAPSSVRPVWWSWPLAACAAAVLATSLVEAWDARRDLQSAQDARERWNGPSQASVHPGARDAAPVATSEARLRAATDIQGALNHPWEAVLTQVESAGSGPAQPGRSISWLNLEHTVSRGDLRLEGQCADKSHALQVSNAWAGRPGWRSVLLSRFQGGQDGMPGQRFELTAKVHVDELKADAEAPLPIKPDTGGAP